MNIPIGQPLKQQLINHCTCSFDQVLQILNIVFYNKLLAATNHDHTNVHANTDPMVEWHQWHQLGRRVISNLVGCLPSLAGLIGTFFFYRTY
jgi:hypothetical protein